MTKAYRVTLKGIYVLVISVTRESLIPVGALGPSFFPKGIYAYIGSAKNNLAKRVRRHLTHVKSNFWHIDYLLSSDVAQVVNVFYSDSIKSDECTTARLIARHGLAYPRFGCSDCNCESHLYLLKNHTFLRAFMKHLPLYELEKEA